MKRIILISLLLYAITVLAQPGQKEDEKTPSDSSQQKASSFKAQDPHKTVLDFGLGKLKSIKLDENGVPTSLYGDLNAGITASDPVEKCYQFFEIHKELFGFENPREELKLKRSKINEDGSGSVSFSQIINDIKVRFGGYSLHFRSNGRMSGVNGQISLEARKVDTTPSISEEQAKQIAVNDPRTRGSTLEHARKVELMIINHKGRLLLAWNINVTNLGAGINSDFYVDAKTGEMLQEVTNLRF